MAKPTLTPAQLEAVKQTIANQTTQAEAMRESAELQIVEIDRAQKVDQAFAGLFNHYDGIIKAYDDERKAINGEFVISPIVEADIQGAADNPPSGRLLPNPPISDLVRIVEFDAAGYAGYDGNNELANILAQALIESTLTSGTPGTSPSLGLGAATSTALSPISDTLTVTATSGLAFSTGDVFIVYGAGDAAIVEVLNATSHTPPAIGYDLDIKLLLAPDAIIGAGASMLASFFGFNNTERTNKTASDFRLQPIMNKLINQLIDVLNNRKNRNLEQLAAIQDNEDDDGIAELGIAQTEAETTRDFITNYLISVNISDAGINTLIAERGTRTSFLNTRISQILNNYTNQTEDYYESRYQQANHRGNTQRGTLRMLKNAQSVKSTMENMAAGLDVSVTALNSILD